MTRTQPDRPATDANPDDIGQGDAPDFGAEVAANVLQAACAEVGLDPRSATLLRLGENAIFALQEPAVVVRIARNMSALPDVQKETRVAGWLARCGLRAAQLWDVPQPVIADGRPVTFWRRIEDTHQPASTADLGAVLKALHGCPVTEDVDLPQLSIFGRVAQRLDTAKGVSEHDRSFLRRRVTELQDAFDHLPARTQPTAIHGDAHADNLVCEPDGSRTLIDFEAFAVGPPEFDLTMTAAEHEVGFHTSDAYAAFCAAYGYDVMTWEGYPVLRDITWLRMTTWLMQNVAEDPAIHREFEKRMRTLRDPSSREPWAPF